MKKQTKDKRRYAPGTRVCVDGVWGTITEYAISQSADNKHDTYFMHRDCDPRVERVLWIETEVIIKPKYMGV